VGPFMLFDGPCDTTTASTVRRALRDLQAVLEVRSRTVEDLELAATELITNAVRAGALHLDIQLSVLLPRLELAVTDDGPGMPTPREPAPGAVTGRGLQILAALADEWGYTAGEISKTVWARFAR
jgi:anti-sigma regulatory factor (Ser/Thr protein kinase)